MPLHRRLPKRGFTNIFRTEYSVINLGRIAELQAEGHTESPSKPSPPRACSRTEWPGQVLGDGELTGAVTVHAHKFSKSAQEKIEKAGGKAVLSPSKSGRKSDGCPMFAPAYMGRKRWAQPYDRFHHSTENP